MSSQILLSGGDKWFSYSGEVFGDVSVPATIPMITIDNTGLRDSYIVVQPYFGAAASTSNGMILGLTIKIDSVVVVNTQGTQGNVISNDVLNETFNLFVPRNSKLEIISRNTTDNNTQIRGANVIGYYL
jgi:hypothetical protein